MVLDPDWVKKMLIHEFREIAKFPDPKKDSDASDFDEEDFWDEDFGPLVSLDKLEEAHLFPEDQELDRNFEDDFFF